MTELKSIWHKPSERPTEHKTIFAQHKSLRDGSIDCFMWELQEFTDAIRKGTIAWCYLDDLIVCEKELTDTKKKLDEIKSDIDEMIAQSHDIGERFAEVVLCNLKNKIEQIKDKE